MADFRVSKAKKKGESKEARPVAVTPDPEVSRSLLAKVGGGTASGLHTIGSILSTPSRVLWGSINGLAGGEGGFGNMNPLDSTGGIELSHVLGNAGVIAKNDPTKWEWGDLGRGLVDIAGDPTSWAGVGGLTRAGVTASKLTAGTAGALERGVINQFRAGQRGIVSVHHPLSVESRGAFGTGAAVGDAIESGLNRSGATRVTNAVGNFTPIRQLRAAFDSRMKGKTEQAIQRYAPHLHELEKATENHIKREHYAMAMNHYREGFHQPGQQELLRDVAERVATGTPVHHAAVDQMRLYREQAHAMDKVYGIRGAHGDNIDDVADFPRFLSQGVDLGEGHGWPANTINSPSRQDVYKNLGGTNAINRMVTDPVVDQAINAASHLPIQDQIARATHVLMANNPHIVDHDQLGDLARKMVGTPAMRQEGLFGNYLLNDLTAYRLSRNKVHRNADVMFNAISDSMHDGPHGQNVRQFLQGAGFHEPEVAAAHIARIQHPHGAANAAHVQAILNAHIPDNLAHELRTFAPGYTSEPAVRGLLDSAKSLQTIWKAAMLAMPASRTRDFAGGVLQNAAMEHAGPTGFNLARNMVHAQPLGRDFSHLPEVRELMDNFHLSSDEAVRAIMAVEAPRASNAVTDIAPGAVGAGLMDTMHNVPGTFPSGVRETFGRAFQSLRHGELGPNGTPISTGSVYNPANATGALEHVLSGEPRRATGFGPYAASNVLSGAGDEFNRTAGILGQMAQDYNPSVAGKRTRAAQVDYDPSTFSAFESNVMKNAMPFYSFASRMGKHTAGELIAHPGGRTAQLIKAEDRAHAQDPSLPDSVLSGTSIPLGASEDGTKRLLQGAGLMHEQAVNTLGAALGGNTRGAMYDAAGMLNPLLRVPLEQMTGQSFFQRGEPQGNLDPNIGRTLSNVAVMAGQRDPEAGPVKYPGSHAVETAIGISPLSRIASTVRTLTDTRKSAAEKAANTLTGAKITSISPKKQAYTLIRRAEDLAKASGAKSRADVYFSKAELDKIKESDPALYEKQKGLQVLLNNLKAQTKKPSTAKPKSGKFKIKRVEKAPKQRSKKAPNKKFERVTR